jgi:hypothetical protein
VCACGCWPFEEMPERASRIVRDAVASVRGEPWRDDGEGDGEAKLQAFGRDKACARARGHLAL